MAQRATRNCLVEKLLRELIAAQPAIAAPAGERRNRLWPGPIEFGGDAQGNWKVVFWPSQHPVGPTFPSMR